MGSLGIGHWIIIGLIVWGVFGYLRRASGSDSVPSVCPACGTQGEPARKTRGSILIEVILWLCFIIPGLVYSIWRMGSRYEVCPACGQPGMIPINSPNGQRLAAQSRLGRS